MSDLSADLAAREWLERGGAEKRKVWAPELELEKGIYQSAFSHVGITFDFMFRGKGRDFP
jgi:hypothetical protein